jgi:hypothetical protein
MNENNTRWYVRWKGKNIGLLSFKEMADRLKALGVEIRDGDAYKVLIGPGVLGYVESETFAAERDFHQWFKRLVDKICESKAVDSETLELLSRLYASYSGRGLLTMSCDAMKESLRERESPDSVFASVTVTVTATNEDVALILMRYLGAPDIIRPY